MSKSYELVKRWNAMKGTRYQVTSKDGDSAIVRTINGVYVYVNDEANVDRYFEAMLSDANKNDIWMVADKYACKRWIANNPIDKVAEEEPKKEEVKMENVLGLLSKEIVALIGQDMAKQVADKVKAEMDAYVSDKVICKVVEYDGKRNKIEDMTHEVFETVLKFVAMNEPVFLLNWTCG